MTQTVTTDQDINQLDMHDGEEVLIPPHIKYLPVTDVANPSDPLLFMKPRACLSLKGNLRLCKPQTIMIIVRIHS